MVGRIVVTGLLIAAPLGAVLVFFGSTSSFAAYASGAYLEALPLDLGTIPLTQGDQLVVPIKLVNRSASDFVVTGASVTCGCVRVEPVPLRVPPGSAVVRLRVNTELVEPGEHSFSVDFHFDKPNKLVRSFLKVAVASAKRAPQAVKAQEASSNELKPVPMDVVPKKGERR